MSEHKFRGIYSIQRWHKLSLRILRAKKAGIFFKAFLSVFLMNPVSLVLAKEGPDYRAELKQTQVVLKASARIQIEKIESESKAKLNDGPPEKFPNCRRIDLAEYKAATLNFKPTFETAVNACLDQFTPLASTAWRSLNRSLTSQAYDFEDALVLVSVALKDASESSPKRVWMNEIVSNFKAGNSHIQTMQKAFESCIRWANLDADLVLVGQDVPSIIEDFDRDLDRGSVICGER